MPRYAGWSEPLLVAYASSIILHVTPHCFEFSGQFQAYRRKEVMKESYILFIRMKIKQVAISH